ncbi:MAG: hypothetical protein AAF269_00660 [Pseudomonadota bacterium]
MSINEVRMDGSRKPGQMHIDNKNYLCEKKTEITLGVDLKKTPIFISTVLICAACSGSGGNQTPQPPQVVTPPPNNAPTLTLEVIPTSLDERQSFTLDASRSSDADGDALTYQVEFSPSDLAQLADASSAPVWSVETFEVDQNETVSVTVTVSDGRDTASETLEFTLLNYERTPLTSLWGRAADRFSDATLADRNLGWSHPFGIDSYMYTLTRADNNTGRIQQFRFLDDAIPAPTDIELGVEITGQEDFYRFPLDFSVGPDFVLHSQETGQVQIFRRESNSEVSEAGDFTIADSCSIGATQTGDSFVAGEPLGLIVGTPNGLTALLNNGSPFSAPQSAAQIGTFSESRIIATTGDFCELDFNQFNTSENARFYDAARQEIVPIRNGRGSMAQLDTPLTVDAPSDMTLVDVAGGYMSFGSYYTALLFAGESHTSDHQLTIVHQFFGPPQEQVDIALPHGVPSSLYVAPFNGSGLATDIIVTVPETPYAYVFKNISQFNQVRFEPIEFLDVGFGVTGIDQIRTERGAISNYLVTNDGQTLTIYPSVP